MRELWYVQWASTGAARFWRSFFFLILILNCCMIDMQLSDFIVDTRTPRAEVVT